MGRSFNKYRGHCCLQWRLIFQNARQKCQCCAVNECIPLKGALMCVVLFFPHPGQNYCAVNNGGCTHLCLATPGGRSCKCPDHAVGVNCVESDSRYWAEEAERWDQMRWDDTIFNVSILNCSCWKCHWKQDVNCCAFRHSVISSPILSKIPPVPL